MMSLIRTRPSDRGLLSVKPSSRAAPSSGYGQASGSENKGGSRDGKAKGEIAVMKPWADQPWPLIEMPSRTQHITHPALHIANEIAHIHNAMLRGLNSIYLQAPHVQQTQDIADLLFLTQSWGTWLLDHHHLKENTMLPGFEAALGVPAGTLALPSIRSPLAAYVSLDGDISSTMKGKDKEAYGEEEETISFLLHRVYAYASATHKDPQAYNAATLEGLLVALADTLVPHLTRQVGRLASMREMCSGSSPAINTTRDDEIPGPLPLPMVTITRTSSNNAVPSTSPSASPPASPSSSTFSSASASTSASSPAQSPPTVSLSLFPSTTTRPQHQKPVSSSEIKKAKTNGPDPGARDLDVIDTEAQDRLARARALLGADDRANKLTQVYTTAEAQAAASIDHFVIPPMIVRLRDATTATSFSSPALSRTVSSQSLSSSSSRGSRRASKSMGMGIGVGGAGGVGGGNKGDWPRLSVPAIHAIADKLSPRHEGAWRFLPCDVWGRPRELPFLGS
ncbi:hypothetical protein ANO14919_105020 [Xylariales sp. No.14919]|nr:hypothetical protein ANO14919_105020 [Xylariales sp. No.14919]